MRDECETMETNQTKTLAESLRHNYSAASTFFVLLFGFIATQKYSNTSPSFCFTVSHLAKCCCRCVRICLCFHVTYSVTSGYHTLMMDVKYVPLSPLSFWWFWFTQNHSLGFALCLTPSLPASPGPSGHVRPYQGLFPWITQLPGSEGTHKLLHCGNVGVGVSTLVKMCLFYLTSWLHSQWVKATVICNTLCLFSLSWRRKKWRRPSNLKSLMSTA